MDQERSQTVWPVFSTPAPIVSITICSWRSSCEIRGNVRDTPDRQCLTHAPYSWRPNYFCPPCCWLPQILSESGQGINSCWCDKDLLKGNSFVLASGVAWNASIEPCWEVSSNYPPTKVLQQVMPILTPEWHESKVYMLIPNLLRIISGVCKVAVSKDQGPNSVYFVFVLIKH